MSLYLEIIYNENNLTKTREYVKFLLSSKGNKKTKIETMLSTRNKHINKSGIGYIDYMIGGDRNQNPEPLNELICDIIFIFTALDEKFLLNENKDGINSINFPKDLLGKTTANIKFIFKYIGLPIGKKLDKAYQNKI